jgi:hypothetical protein
VSKLKQQDLPAEDLSDLGAPVARGAGLSGFLSEGVGEPSAPPQARPSGRPETEGDVIGSGAADVPAPPPARGRRPGRPRTRTKPVTAVYVSPGVKQRFEAYRHKQKATNIQVVLEAISTKHHELADIIKQSAFSTAPVNPLFPADPSAVRYVGGGSVQIGFSATAEQEQVLDRIGAEQGFDTRSTWIAPVLNAFLPGRKDAAPVRD